VLSIGPHKLRNNVLLAPMAGVTDAPFRDLVWRYGAGYVVGEMISSRADLWDSQKSRMRRRFTSATGPRAVQIAGGDPDAVAASARRHWHAGADIVDINFGCPAKKVCRKAAGSQLLRDPDLVVRIVQQTVAAVDIPITVKMRTGWCRADRNAPDIARRLEDAGIAALAVHGRTRQCRFSGTAEHDTVAAIKARVGIPVFANGDIGSLAEARRVIGQTGCDGVMIGRAALGRPWLLGDIAAGAERRRGALERMGVLAEHVRALHDFYGDPGVRIARKHVHWFVQCLELECASEPMSADGLPWVNFKKKFNQLEEAGAQLDYLRGYALRLAA
jgi:tRNA-dihydrouridine synthase B